jgi:hypothetical protein
MAREWDGEPLMACKYYFASLLDAEAELALKEGCFGEELLSS